MPKKIIPTWVYVAEALDGNGPLYVKVGISRAVESRLLSIQTGCPIKITAAKKILLPSCEVARSLESGLHRALAESNSSGEWFRFEDPEEGRSRVALASEDFLKYRSRWKFEPIDVTTLAKVAREKRMEKSVEAAYERFLIEQKRRVSRNFAPVKLPEHAKDWVLTRPSQEH
ncbi:GIY-YIG nuclease family protein [Stenotrophomonas maltophilia]|uniref:GIY-YIG nuclease family protein n=1 Tax=Stenotrophomonas maltophilia TaxID=40324 RepID=UPI0007F8E7A5|nr:GIY-YIG nuclease family protein [Stenotrophomonas maltophilia]OBU59195.1 hypothetical protein A9K70_01345 [Stenotrophomonas maltophilia]